MNLIYKTTPKKIVDAVSAISGFSPTERTTQGHSHSTSKWRQIGIYVARHRGLTLKEAGETFNRHFTTAIVSEKRVAAQVGKNKDVDRALASINDFIEKENNSHGDQEVLQTG